jgi:hypothetical protein
MSMISTFLVKKTGTKDKFITQQYEVGLYIAIYHGGDPIPSQTTSDVPEKEFHKKLREGYNKRAAAFLPEESSSLEDIDEQIANITSEVDALIKLGKRYAARAGSKRKRAAAAAAAKTTTRQA